MNSYSTSWWSLLLIYRSREDERLYITTFTPDSMPAQYAVLASIHRTTARQPCHRTARSLAVGIHALRALLFVICACWSSVLTQWGSLCWILCAEFVPSFSWSRCNVLTDKRHYWFHKNVGQAVCELVGDECVNSLQQQQQHTSHFIGMLCLTD